MGHGDGAAFARGCSWRFAESLGATVLDISGAHIDGSLYHGQCH